MFHLVPLCLSEVTHLNNLLIANVKKKEKNSINHMEDKALNVSTQVSSVFYLLSVLIFLITRLAS